MTTADYYVSPDGSDSNSGSETDPLGTVHEAVSRVQAGDLVYVRGGTYNHQNGDPVVIDGKSGSADARITIEAYPDETPHLTWEGGSTQWDMQGGIDVKNGASYWTLKGLHISESPALGIYNRSGCHHNHFVDLDLRSNGNSGIESKGNDTVIDGCVSYDNFDEQKDGEDADGLVLAFVDGGVIRNSVCYNNSDDGIDLWSSQNVKVTGNVVYANGGGSNGDGNGIKLGGGDSSGSHIVHRNISYNNRMRGITFNYADYPMEVYNNTVVDNGDIGMHFQNTAHKLRNNISIGNSKDYAIDSNVTHDHNTWNLGISQPNFRSKDPESTDFMCLADGSKCIDAGVDIGLDFTGSNPDLGGIEFASSDWNQPAIHYHDGSEFVPVQVKQK